MAEQILQEIDVHRYLVTRYEDSQFQYRVLQSLPLGRLRDEALKAGNSNNLTFHEHFIKQVMNWFKTEFFSWVDCKPCGVCGSPSRSGPPLSPSSQELRDGAARVENHICTACGASQRFPRYNSPTKLLQSREGRCGEWANCFTGICRALGYDARYIYDATDHVWTEIYSVHLGRWVHMDVCENAWDRPLVYEQGWKKKLSYVIAFSKDEVVDVSFRYTLDPIDLATRRPNAALVQAKIGQLKFSHTPEKRALLQTRLAKELTSMLLKPGSHVTETYRGRESGSVAWRQGRGEDGITSQADHITVQIKAQESFKLTYSPVQDIYTLVTDGNSDQVVSNFSSLTYSTKEVMRKVEYDWNMVYLARTSNNAQSFIEWRFSCEKPIASAAVHASHETFEGGHVTWSCDPLEPSPNYHSRLCEVDLQGLQGKREFSIRAKLWSTGTQDNSWQHSQLFRTSLSDNEPPFSVELTF